MDSELKPLTLKHRRHCAPFFQPLRLFLNGNDAHTCASCSMQEHFSRTVLALPPIEETSSSTCQVPKKECPVLQAVQHLGRQMDACGLNIDQDLDCFSWLTKTCTAMPTLIEELRPQLRQCTSFGKELEGLNANWILDGGAMTMEFAELLETPLPSSPPEEKLTLMVRHSCHCWSVVELGFLSDAYFTSRNQ